VLARRVHNLASFGHPLVHCNLGFTDRYSLLGISKYFLLQSIFHATCVLKEHRTCCGCTYCTYRLLTLWSPLMVVPVIRVKATTSHGVCTQSRDLLPDYACNELPAHGDYRFSRRKRRHRIDAKFTIRKMPANAPRLPVTSRGLLKPSVSNTCS